jgi:hypothetical protein
MSGAGLTLEICGFGTAAQAAGHRTKKEKGGLESPPFGLAGLLHGLFE